MEVLVSVLAQITVTAENDEDYKKELDELLAQLEHMGFSVNVENESTDDGWFDDDYDEDEDGDFDENDEDEDDEDDEEY